MKRTPHRRPGPRAFGAAALIALTTALFASAAAPAAQAIGAVAFEQASVTAEYGAGWSATVTAHTRSEKSFVALYDDDGIEIARTAISPYGAGSNAAGALVFYISSTSFPALDAGDYSLVASFTEQFIDITDVSPPLPLTIEPAAAAAQLEIEADPAAPRNAIVTVQLSGAFADRYSYDEEYGYISPRLPRAGTWSVEFTDSSGQSVFSRQISRDEGDLSVATLYWLGVPAGQTFTGTASFEPAEASDNWAFSPTVSVPYTPPPTPAGPGVIPASDPGATDIPAAEATSSGPSVPLWSLIAAGAVALFAAIAAIVLGLLLGALRRRRRAASDAGSASGPAAGSDAAAGEPLPTVKETSNV